MTEKEMIKRFIVELHQTADMLLEESARLQEYAEGLIEIQDQYIKLLKDLK